MYMYIHQNKVASVCTVELPIKRSDHGLPFASMTSEHMYYYGCNFLTEQLYRTHRNMAVNCLRGVHIDAQNSVGFRYLARDSFFLKLSEMVYSSYLIQETPPTYVYIYVRMYVASVPGWTGLQCSTANWLTSLCCKYYVHIHTCTYSMYKMYMYSTYGCSMYMYAFHSMYVNRNA